MAPSVKLLILLLFLAPVAAQPVSTETILWIHSGFGAVHAMNTQPPQDQFFGGPGSSLAPVGTTCTPIAGGSVLRLSARLVDGPVQYDVDEGGQPRSPPANHQDAIRWDSEIAPELTLSLLADAAIAPQVVVGARMDVGGPVPLNEYPPIAAGRTDPATLTPFIDHPDFQYREVNGNHVYTASFDLDWRGSVTTFGAVSLEANVQMDVPCDGETGVPAVQLLDGPGFWPHLHLNVMDDITISTIQAAKIGDDFVFRAAPTTTWGWYDIAGDRYDSGEAPTARLVGAGQNWALERTEWPWRADVLQFQPPTTAWRLADANLTPNTEYAIHVELSNDQGTLVRTLSFLYTTPSAGQRDQAGGLEPCTFEQDGPTCIAGAPANGPAKSNLSLWWLALLLLPMIAFMALWQTPGEQP